MKKYCLSEDNLKHYNDLVDGNLKYLSDPDNNNYIDPDSAFVERFKINGKPMRFSPDGICGIKYLKKYYENQDLIDAYRIVRTKIIVWPKHPQSINQRRFACFRDRLDFTLFDIKNFYETDQSKLLRRDSNSSNFIKYLGSFKNFISEYELEAFVRKEGIVNLASSDEEVISHYDDYGYSPEINKRYLENLIGKLER